MVEIDVERTTMKKKQNVVIHYYEPFDDEDPLIGIYGDPDGLRALAEALLEFASIGIAAVQTAIEYEYRPPRRTEYRFAEYEYDEIQCKARTSYMPDRVERPPESASATVSKLCFIIPRYVSAPEPTGPSASE